MPITATNKGGSSYEPIPAGTYPARCYSMIHIGTIEENILGQTKKLNKVRITWELPTETKVFKEENGEQPYSISKEFTLSMNEKSNLRKFLEGWRGVSFTEKEAEAFDVTVLIGKPCLLSVIHKSSKNGNTYAEISSVSTLPKGMSCPKQINSSFEFNYNPFSLDKFETLPDFLKDKMKQSEEYKFAITPHITEAMASKEMDNETDLPW